MLVFVVFIVTVICGILSAYINAKIENKGGVATFISMCFGGAALGLITLVCLYFSVWLASAFAIATIAFAANTYRKFTQFTQSKV